MLDGKKILIAEDDVMMMNVYKEYFAFKKETKVANMLYAMNVKECLGILEKEKPLLMFLDLGLEDRIPPPGFEILRDYKDKLKIIIVSGYHEYESECMAKGALKFLGKPVDNKLLIQLMIEYA